MKYETGIPEFTIRNATLEDCSTILGFIRRLGEYEKMVHEVVATEEALRETLFGPRPFAEVVLGEYQDRPVGFALFFHNYSTFMGRPGLYLEDLYVDTDMRGKGFGKSLLCFLGKIALDRGCGRFEWCVLDWNKPAIDFYLSLGAKPMDEWTTYRVDNDNLNKLADQFGRP